MEQAAKMSLTASRLRIQIPPQMESKCTYQKLEELVEKLELEGKKPEPKPKQEKPQWLDGVPKNRKLPFDLFIENFWSRTKVCKSGCWEWSGPYHSNQKGREYGTVWHGQTKFKTHKIAYILTKGKISEGMYICHKCDNPKCVNPDHLYQGTPKDNNSDCIKRNRANREKGEERYCAKLTEENVNSIRLEYVKKYGEITRLARKYGVSCTAIYNVVHHVRWKHVKS